MHMTDSDLRQFTALQDDLSSLQFAYWAMLCMTAKMAASSTEYNKMLARQMRQYERAQRAMRRIRHQLSEPPTEPPPDGMADLNYLYRLVTRIKYAAEHGEFDLGYHSLHLDAAESILARLTFAPVANTMTPPDGIQADLRRVHASLREQEDQTWRDLQLVNVNDPKRADYMRVYERAQEAVHAAIRIEERLDAPPRPSREVLEELEADMLMRTMECIRYFVERETALVNTLTEIDDAALTPQEYDACEGNSYATAKLMLTKGKQRLGEILGTITHGQTRSTQPDEQIKEGQTLLLYYVALSADKRAAVLARLGIDRSNEATFRFSLRMLDTNVAEHAVGFKRVEHFCATVRAALTAVDVNNAR